MVDSNATTGRWAAKAWATGGYTHKRPARPWETSVRWDCWGICGVVFLPSCRTDRRNGKRNMGEVGTVVPPVEKQRVGGGDGGIIIVYLSVYCVALESVNERGLSERSEKALTLSLILFPFTYTFMKPHTHFSSAYLFSPYFTSPRLVDHDNSGIESSYRSPWRSSVSKRRERY